MLAFSKEPVQTRVMQRELNISLRVDDNGTVVIINGQERYIDYTHRQTLADLRMLLADEPQYIFDAVVVMLRGLAT